MELLGIFHLSIEFACFRCWFLKVPLVVLEDEGTRCEVMLHLTGRTVSQDLGPETAVPVSYESGFLFRKRWCGGFPQAPVSLAI